MIWADGALIPFATSVGNHDVGLDAYALWAKYVYDENYYTFF